MKVHTTATSRLVRCSNSANSFSANVPLLIRVWVRFTTYILSRLVRIRLVRVDFFRNASFALNEKLL